MNPNSQWNPNMGGGYPGGPGKKNRGGLTKEVIIALLIAVAAIVFVVAETVGLWFLCTNL